MHLFLEPVVDIAKKLQLGGLPDRLRLDKIIGGYHGATAQRLHESVGARSFLALGVAAVRVDRMVDLLVRRHGAAAPGTRDAMGLAALVEQSLPAVTDAVEAAGQEADEGQRPVVLTDVAPLARYGHLGILSKWADLAAARRQAIWVVVPQLLSNQGPLIDGRPLPLAAPGQFLRVDAEWLTTKPTVPAS